MTMRSVRTLVALLAALALVGALTAVPVVAQTPTPTCEAISDETATEEVTDGVTLTYDAEFACADADATGTWSITVNVSNESDADVTIAELTLSHATPPFGEDGANTVTSASLPLDVPAGAAAAFDASGDYALVETDDGDLVNLHLRASGSTLDDEAAPFVLGINVHVLGPGVELDDDDGEGAADGRPEWVPGPPPWVIEILSAIFGDSFPWGSDTFPPAAADESDETGASAEDAGPPAGLELPPPATSGGDDAGEAPPSWVTPGEPPAWVPVGGGDEEGAEGRGGPPSGTAAP